MLPQNLLKPGACAKETGLNFFLVICNLQIILFMAVQKFKCPSKIHTIFKGLAFAGAMQWDCRSETTFYSNLKPSLIMLQKMNFFNIFHFQHYSKRSHFAGPGHQLFTCLSFMCFI